MVSATPQRHKQFICCSIPEPKAYLIFELPKSKSTCRFLKMAMRNRNKAGDVMGTIPRKYGWLYFIKHK